MFDLIIVGSGAAGTWAARQAAKSSRKILLLDVGHRPTVQAPLAGDLATLRRRDAQQFDYLIGTGFEALASITGASQSPKLRAPRFHFVTQGASAFSPLSGRDFSATQSFAAGGLANAWGAGAYRYDSADLQEFAFAAGALEPFYDELTQAIGVSGDADDLAAHFGSDEGLQPPHPLSRLGKKLLAGYAKRRTHLNAAGFTIGHPRLALLRHDLGERKACPYDHLSFFEPNLPYVYTPRQTLDELVRARQIVYRDERLVVSFAESNAGVRVETRDAHGQAAETFVGRRLILAAGALNSARLVLQSAHDYSTRLPLLDNQTTMVPFIVPSHVGRSPDSSSHGLGQAIVIYRGPLAESYIQGTFYTFQSLLANEVIQDFPLSMRGAAAACRAVLPAFAVVTCFYPEAARSGNRLQLEPSGALALRYQDRVATGAVEAALIRGLRPLGFLSHPSLIRTGAPGSGIHYAGTLPMTAGTSAPYTTNAEGLLAGTQGVYVADAAVFPHLPAKNHTLTVMANAMRTAQAALSSMGPS